MNTPRLNSFDFSSTQPVPCDKPNTEIPIQNVFSSMSSENSMTDSSVGDVGSESIDLLDIFTASESRPSALFQALLEVAEMLSHE